MNLAETEFGFIVYGTSWSLKIFTGYFPAAVLATAWIGCSYECTYLVGSAWCVVVCAMRIYDKACCLSVSAQ